MYQMQTNLCETQIIGARTREQIVASAADRALSAHGIVLVGVSDARHGFSFVRERPSIGVVLVCFQGEGRVLARNEWRTCAPGMAYVTPPGVPHAYRSTEGAPWGLCWVAYRGSDTPFSLPTPRLLRADPAALRSAALGLYRESVGRAEAPFLHHWAGLVHLQAARITQGPRRDERLWRLWEMVDADLARAWTVDALAGLAFMSGEHLRYLCQQELGRSPVQHVRYLRMQRAAVLLLYTDESVETIARLVGYANPYAFSTAFKRFHDSSPSQYRTSHRASR